MSTAAIIIVGDEILSGRTQDTNSHYIARHLSDVGIILNQVRVVGDKHSSIFDSVSNLRKCSDYLFITGGIGPTHDDITTQAVADSFRVSLKLNQEAYDLIKDFSLKKGLGFNSARIKMAYLPDGCELIYNSVSGSPGFIIDNVYVMAGVPSIMYAMFQTILPTLNHGKKFLSKHIDLIVGESYIAEDFEKLQNKYPKVMMGSYPFKNDLRHGTSLVLRSSDDVMLDLAYKELLFAFNAYVDL